MVSVLYQQVLLVRLPPAGLSDSKPGDNMCLLSRTGQYNLVPGLRAVMFCGREGNRGSGGKVDAYTAGFLASVTCGLTALDRDQLRTATLASTMGIPLALPVLSVVGLN